MNFTRDPLIETVITPKEGFKLALRNSKGSGQEEYFVDAVEVISFGKSCFYRSLEKPKSFLVPISDYEILEVRETRMVLKTAKVEKGIKIAGGREAAIKPSREEKEEVVAEEESKVDKRRERRRPRKRRTKDEAVAQEASSEKSETEGNIEKPSLIPPPSTLISETIDRYKDLIVHETDEEAVPPEKKKEECFEEPSEDSLEKNPEAQNDEQVPL